MEVRIKKKFAYKVTASVIESLNGKIHPPLDKHPQENNKKQINKIPNKKKQNNLVVIDPDAKELMLSVPLRHKNSFYFSYLPDPVTIFLNLSYEALQKIEQLEGWLEKEYVAGKFVMLTNENNFHQKKFAHAMTNIVFLIMSVEALVNELLPEMAVFGGKEITKSQMEEKLPLDEKLKILKKNGLAFEETKSSKLFHLKKLRDAIVHFKSYSGDINKVKSVCPFDEILNLDVRRYYDEITALIETISPGRIEYINPDA